MAKHYVKPIASKVYMNSKRVRKHIKRKFGKMKWSKLKK